MGLAIGFPDQESGREEKNAHHQGCHCAFLNQPSELGLVLGTGMQFVSEPSTFGPDPYQIRACHQLRNPFPSDQESEAIPLVSTIIKQYYCNQHHINNQVTRATSE